MIKLINVALWNWLPGDIINGHIKRS